MTTNHTVENASLGAGITTGLMGVITENATAISVLATVGFGVIYASCAIWNAYSNHRRNKLNKVVMINDLIDDLISEGKPTELIKILNEKKYKL